MSPAPPYGPANTAPLDRGQLPPVLPPPDIELPAIQKAILPGGLRVWFVERHALPHIALNLVIDAGTDHDPPSMPGLTAFTAEMLEAGTSTMSALAIADRLDFIGAALSIHAALDGTSAAMYTLTKHFSEAVGVLGEIFSSPVFPPEEIERVRSQRRTALLQQRDRPAYVANMAFHRILYGTHPYGNDPTGTEASLNAIAREDIKGFYETHLRPTSATLIVVGDAEAEPLSAELQKAFGNWKQGSGEPHPVEPVPVPPLRKVYLLDKPGAPQSEIRIGCQSLRRNTPDFFPVIVMNRILGGQFSSRINRNLREEHGYTYGAWSAFRFAKQEGPFVALGGFISDKTDRAIVELLSEIDGMHAHGITQAELDFSKKGICGSFALNFETPLQIANTLQNIVLYGLPDDYYQQYVRNVQAVTLEDVARVSRKYLDSSTMSILVVGDVAKIKEPIEKLELGELVVARDEKRL